MVVVMDADAAPDAVDTVVSVLGKTADEVYVSRGGHRVVVVAVGEHGTPELSELHEVAGVVEIAAVSHPFTFVSREHRRERSTVTVGGVPIGPDAVTVIAGPCAVESPEQTLEAAAMAARAGATLLRGGAYKPRTSPYSFQGLGEAGLHILADVRAATGLPVVTEVVSAATVDLVAKHADMLQVGARNMQNFELLRAVGECDRPVLLKRGSGATVEEWLMAAEYIAQRGNLEIVLCERGIRTFETAVRNTLDVSAVPVVQQLSHLPVVVDPSHSGGRRDLVAPLSRAAVASGADGLIVDVHPHPETARCDGAQALVDADLSGFLDDVAAVGRAVGRTV